MPRSLPEVYAKEAIYLHEEPRRELKLQAIRIGELGITAIPNEVFAITGLKLKAQSPFDTTMNIELANGSEGYIPPPEQHALGGYTTWPARTAGLEVQAEPKIVATVLELLEKVAGKPRRPLRVVHGSYAEAVLASRPLAYWRLEDIEGSTAVDSTGHARNAVYEGGVALFLPGPSSAGFSAGKMVNRAVHLAGGRLKAKFDGVRYLQHRALVLERLAGRRPAGHRSSLLARRRGHRQITHRLYRHRRYEISFSPPLLFKRRQLRQDPCRQDRDHTQNVAPSRART